MCFKPGDQSPVPRSHFVRAFAQAPRDGSGQLQDRQGPSYRGDVVPALARSARLRRIVWPRGERPSASARRILDGSGRSGRTGAAACGVRLLRQRWREPALPADRSVSPVVGHVPGWPARHPAASTVRFAYERIPARDYSSKPPRVRPDHPAGGSIPGDNTMGDQPGGTTPAVSTYPGRLSWRRSDGAKTTVPSDEDS
jgi:hypothetical protein